MPLAYEFRKSMTELAPRAPEREPATGARFEPAAGVTLASLFQAALRPHSAALRILSASSLAASSRAICPESSTALR
jgi:hypothetical protein